MFLVDRVVAGLTAEVLAEARRCLQEAARRVSAEGDVVTLLRCTFLPDQQRCLDLFEAVDAETVRRVNDIAQLPFRSIGRASEDALPLSGVRPHADPTSKRSGHA